jgi:hypothetical protein
MKRAKNLGAGIWKQDLRDTKQELNDGVRLDGPVWAV